MSLKTTDSNLFTSIRNETALFTQIHEPTAARPPQMGDTAGVIQGIKETALKRKETCPLVADTMDRIIERADRNLERLNQNRPVKLPVYYHATKTDDAAKKILEGSLKAQNAIEGPGVYISSEIEPRYGSYIFAFSREDVENRELSTSNVNKSKYWSQSHTGKAVWRALKDDLPVAQDGKINAAYLILKDKDTQETANFQASIQSLNLQDDFEVVSYEEAAEERAIISSIQGVFENQKWSESWQVKIPSFPTSQVSVQEDGDADEWS